MISSSDVWSAVQILHHQCNAAIWRCSTTLKSTCLSCIAKSVSVWQPTPDGPEVTPVQSHSSEITLAVFGKITVYWCLVLRPDSVCQQTTETIHKIRLECNDSLYLIIYMNICLICSLFQLLEYDFTLSSKLYRTWPRDRDNWDMPKVKHKTYHFCGGHGVHRIW